MMKAPNLNFFVASATFINGESVFTKLELKMMLSIPKAMNISRNL